MELTDLYEAGAAAERLGVSPSGLRRYASLYEKVHGELPRRPNTQSRLYPTEALERLADARRLVETERAKGILEALQALEDGVRPDMPGAEVETVSRAEMPGDVARAILDELRAVRAELGELRAENEAMRGEIKRLAELPAPPADKVGGAPAGLLTTLLTRLAARIERTLRRS